ncbi:MAG: hypothetical protein Kow00121_09420 [Elainellaceae cyanobacterium]
MTLNDMVRKIVLLMIWLSFVGYTIWLAPLDRPYTWQVLPKLLTFQLQEVNSYLVAIFWMMGVWPMIYACLLFTDGRMQNLRAWPYFIGSNFMGVLCLMPYFLFRQRQQGFVGPKDQWLDLLDRRSTGFTLLGITVLLVAYAVLTGDWQDFTQQSQSQAFVHLITLDWALMGLVFPLTALFPGDMARHSIHNSAVLWAVALVPLFGPLLYLCWRPPFQPAEVRFGNTSPSKA